jgi:hypothetical protein
MGGTIGVDSAIGHGSTFWIELEQTSAPVRQAAARPRSTQPVADRIVVLQIEDNISNTNLIEHVFAERPRIQVMTALQGRLGIDSPGITGRR